MLTCRHVSSPTLIASTSELINTEPNSPLHMSEDHVVVSSSHQSPSLGVSRFRSAQSITILLSV